MQDNYSDTVGLRRRRRRIRSGCFNSVGVSPKPVFSTWNEIPFRSGSLGVSRSFVPSTYDTTETVKTQFTLAYKIFRPQLLDSGKAPLVVIHGGPSIPSNYLYPLANRIDDRSVVFFDQIGCGSSSIPLDINAYSISNAVDDLDNLITHLNFERFHLYGHSYGGIVAYEFIKSSVESKENIQPKLCLSVSLSSTPCNVRKVDQEAEALLRNFKENTHPCSPELNFNMEIERSEVEVQETSAELFRKTHLCRTEKLPIPLNDAYMRKGSVWEGTEVIMDYVATPLSSYTRTKAPPSLVMRGEMDFVSQEYSLLGWQKLLGTGNRNLLTLSECSHHGLLENESLYGETVLSFLLENEACRQ